MTEMRGSQGNRFSGIGGHYITKNFPVNLTRVVVSGSLQWLEMSTSISDTRNECKIGYESIL